eukprot:TRINITY_DN4434_c0_g1_i1.p1 TRINITY_DN4434_c0_g1~~TRINITY_DN4434_c0_g1_i1.p1  ORF type:complete len:458 (-),score=108.78 TRINITY_DN4434_c0_g1_i1:58-1431(-)
MWPIVALTTVAVLVATTLMVVLLQKTGKMAPLVLSFSALHLVVDALRLKHGNIVQFWAAYRRMYLICEPEGVKEVMTTKRDNYYKVQDVREVLQPALGLGLLSSDGDLWTAHRKALAFIAHDEFKKAHFDAIVPAVHKFIAHCQEKERASEDVDLYTAMDACTTEVMEAIVLGVPMPVHVHKALIAMFAELERQVMRLFRWHSYLPSFRRTMKTLDTWLYATIAERRTFVKANPSKVGNDALSRACADGTLNDRELRDNVLTLMFAGHDAIALALTFTTYLVAQHPDVMAKLRAEANQVMGSAAVPTYDMVKDFVYADRVFKEGMRFYSPVPVFGRRAIKDDVICGMKIPAGSGVVLSSWAMHRRADIYTDPLKFDPDRWHADFKPSIYEYFPFAVAPRSCLGKNFAFLEAHTFLPMVARALELECARTNNPREVEWHYGLTAQPKNGMWVRVKTVA